MVREADTLMEWGRQLMTSMATQSETREQGLVCLTEVMLRSECVCGVRRCSMWKQSGVQKLEGARSTGVLPQKTNTGER